MALLHTLQRHSARRARALQRRGDQSIWSIWSARDTARGRLESRIVMAHRYVSRMTELIGPHANALLVLGGSSASLFFAGGYYFSMQARYEAQVSALKLQLSHERQFREQNDDFMLQKMRHERDQQACGFNRVSDPGARRRKMERRKERQCGAVAVWSGGRVAVVRRTCGGGAAVVRRICGGGAAVVVWSGGSAAPHSR